MDVKKFLCYNRLGGIYSKAVVLNDLKCNKKFKMPITQVAKTGK